MTKTKRKQEIMFLNVVLCILVVFIHISSHAVSNFVRPSAAYTLIFVPWRLSAFVVQGFIFLSAVKYFLKSENEFNYFSFMMKRLKAVYMPYVAVVALYYIYFMHHGYFGFSIKEFVFYVLSGSLVSPFYFIVAIMQFYLLMPLWIKMVDNMSFPVAIVISFVIMLVTKHYFPLALSGFEKISGYTDRIFTTYLIYWTAGCYLGRNYDKVCEYIKKNILALAVFFAVAGTADLYFSYNGFVYGQYFSFTENLHMIYCISAIAFLFCLGRWLRNIKIPFLKQLDSVSYNVYLIHCLIIFIVNDQIAKYCISSVTKQFFIRFVVVYAVAFGICILYKNIKKRVFGKIG